MKEKVMKETLLGLDGKFTWLFGQEFFVETEIGNWIWKDPECGDNSFTPYKGTWEEFYKEFGLHGRSKGKHYIADYCGTQFTVAE